MDRIIKKIFGYPRFYDFCQLVLEGDYSSVITRTVNAGQEEKILDIGCGTGYFSQFFNYNYAGVDLNERYVNFAKRYQNEIKNFYVMDAKKISFPDKSFDKIILVNFIHHLADSELELVLKEAQRLAKKEIFIFDMDIERLNFLTPRLLSLDNGKFIRPLERQIALIGGILKIKKSFTFKAPRNLIMHSAIIC